MRRRQENLQIAASQPSFGDAVVRGFACQSPNETILQGTNRRANGCDVVCAHRSVRSQIAAAVIAPANPSWAAPQREPCIAMGDMHGDMELGGLATF
jgi:hypothetical protein